MAEQVWLSLTARERSLVQKALAAYGGAAADRKAARALSRKLARASFPRITVGVHGGIVQWVIGNPFPIRVCDYDGDDEGLPDVDERGQRCTMGFERPEQTLGNNANKNYWNCWNAAALSQHVK